MHHTFSYNSKQQLLGLFGGQEESAQMFNHLWLLDIEQLEWSMETSSTLVYPSTLYTGARISHGSFGDDVRNSICVFGGKNKFGPLNDLWCYDLVSLCVTFIVVEVH